MTQGRRKSVYVKNEDSNLDKEAKKEATKHNYAKRRSPRAERLSKKLTVETKPEAVNTKAESTLPKNLDKSMSHENKTEVPAKKKMDKSNSQKVKKSAGADSTKYASVSTSKFTQANTTATAFTTNSTVSSNSNMTAVVSAVQNPNLKENLKPTTNVQPTSVKPYETKRPLGH